MFKSSNDFHYYAEGKTLSAEASDLGIRASMPMPKTICVESAKTGRMLTFERVGEEFCGEDLAYYKYADLNGYGINMQIWND